MDSTMRSLLILEYRPVLRHFRLRELSSIRFIGPQGFQGPGSNTELRTLNKCKTLNTMNLLHVSYLPTPYLDNPFGPSIETKVVICQFLAPGAV